MLRVLLWCAALVQSFAPRFDARQRCTVPRRAAASGASNAADAATPAAAPHTRRKRYAGRYPRHFSDRYKEHSGDAATVKRVREKGGTPAGTHVPIMVNECLEHLNATGADVAVDCTLGYGGHSSALIAALPQNARLLCFDRDGVELARTSKRLVPLASDGEVELDAVHANYACVGAELAQRKLRASCLLADLGCSSMQIDDPERGFTFKRDGPLDMRMGLAEATAAEFLQRASIKEVAAALRDGADFSRRDSREIAVAILKEPIPTTTTLLADRVRAVRLEEEDCTGHDAVKRAMQALRIVVNGEFDALDELLASLPDILAPGGRAVFLTFHSGEDRRVKKAFKKGVASGIYADAARRPVRPSPGERRRNSRSGCCKLRWCVRALDS
jgi:16S rRNA (cytosine1402-N4)-methyltransferase